MPAIIFQPFVDPSVIFGKSLVTEAFRIFYHLAVLQRQKGFLFLKKYIDDVSADPEQLL